MNDIQIITKAFDAVGIEYVVRTRDEYSYIFVGESRDILNPESNFESTKLDFLILRHKYFEFEDGQLVSYSNF